MATENQIDSKPTCFVVMGFGTKTDYATGRKLDLNKSYQYLIKPVVEKQGLVCERADEINHSGVIDVPMYQKLFGADVVIADLSTANPNAFYELGIRHALKPRTTILISEDKLPYPFDVNRIVIIKYSYLEGGIDYGEVMRFQQELGKKLATVLKTQDTDSPVYTFLNGLVPPSLQTQVAQTMQKVEKALESVSADSTTSVTNSKQSGQDNETLAFLIEKGEQAIRDGKFQVAKAMFSGALNIGTGDNSKCSWANDPYLLQRQAIATYKTEQPDRVTALNEALKLFKEKLDLENTNDPETLGIAGAIERNLFEEGQGIEHLTKSIEYYSRGYYLRYDYYNGISLAFMLNVRTDSVLDAKNEEKITDLVNANRIRLHVLELCEKELKVLYTREQYSNREGVIKPTDFSKELAITREQKFWVAARKAEAYYGLGNMPAYEQTKAEAKTNEYAKWMVDTCERQINLLKALLEKHGHLLNPAWPEIPMIV
ncbi:MAG: tetratricopeptide repeat-containing protein [Chitinophagaceae bacterium]